MNEQQISKVIEILEKVGTQVAVKGERAFELLVQYNYTQAVLGAIGHGLLFLIGVALAIIGTKGFWFCSSLAEMKNRTPLQQAFYENDFDQAGGPILVMCSVFSLFFILYLWSLLSQKLW